MEITFWDKRAETLDRASLRLHQLRLLRESVDRALSTPFYKEKLEKAGLTVIPASSGNTKRVFDNRPAL